MIAFWVAAGVLSAGAAILILLRAAQAAARTAPVDTTSIFYRRQLAEIGDLADRGLLGADERGTAEAEAARRMLSAADQPAEVWSTASSRVPILIAALAAPALALGLYLMLGSPGAADQPFKGRLAHWLDTPPQTLQPGEIAAVVAQKVKEKPNDADGYKYLALARGGTGDLLGAIQALRRGVRVAPDRPDLWEMLGDAELYRANGEQTDAALDAFRNVIRLNPASPAARFQLAAAKIRKGDRAGGLADWRALLADMPASDPRRGNVQAAIAELEGGPAAKPAAPAPPQGLSGDQMTMVQGMVGRLAQRLAANPDDPAGWVQMVKAYAVLGDVAKRDAALKTARARYAGKPEVLDALAKAAATERMK
jgi:cytochrome c-type biogenesis protein CcmH